MGGVPGQAGLGALGPDEPALESLVEPLDEASFVLDEPSPEVLVSEEALSGEVLSGEVLSGEVLSGEPVLDAAFSEERPLAAAPWSFL